MPITLTDAAPTVATLSTSRQMLVGPSGNPRGGASWLVITWAAADQSASNVVSVELGQSADGAVGSHPIDLHPGSAYERWVSVEGCGGIGVSGSSAFDVALRLVG